ncbi:BcPKS16, polyketide synthase [Paraphoma chrysanthemicola]|uniref:BcPKS16, polyketide synthase n=1 Tax=Paraphoma chrysanthemicola TaxID=798071 RepID=A0A8K0RJX0_9PLEO|nr:BcPKS16, polyketide synthase [Paraphoma chrysanthemicola]
MISAAIFCPQSKGTPKLYLDSLRLYLTGHQRFQPIKSTLENLVQDWKTLVAEFPEFDGLPQGLRSAKSIRDWIVDGNAAPLADAMAGTICLPLLVIMQVCQYFQFLEVKRMRHAELIADLKGGAHGYCGGILPAVAVACADDEDEIIRKACAATRVAFAIGVAADFGDDDESIVGPSTIVARIKRPGQLEDLLAKFPGTYHSANTDARSVSIVGPVLTLKALSAYAKTIGLIVQDIHLRGKVHNPENKEIAHRIGVFCETHPGFQLPRASSLKVPLRSNITGRLLVGDESLTKDCVETILAARCEWHTLMKGIAQDLQASDEPSHAFASFGIGDVIPVAPFTAAGLKIVKLDVRSIVEAELQHSVSQENYDYPQDAVAIIGAACRVPGADSLEELWELLERGESRCQEVPSARIDIAGNFRAQLDSRMSKRKFFGNFMDDVSSFDNMFFHISPKEAQNMDPQQRILLEVAYQAMESSGYMATHDRGAGDPVGCFIGMSLIEYLENSTCHAPSASTSTGTLGAFLCGRLSHYFGWTGPSETVDTACSSSLVAINRACSALRTGECPIALAGGVNIMAGCQNFLNLGKAGFLSETGQCKPFDASADGYCRSEGVGLVVLKPLRQALQDADPIIGVIPGIGTNQGGLSASLTVPSGDAQVTLYRNVLRQSGLKPGQITYVEAHGTGTQAGDPVEIASLRTVLGGAGRARPLYIGSLKGNLGHLETGAGVAGVLKVLAMLKHKAIPPQASFTKINPKFPPLEPDGLAISKIRRPWQSEFKAALVSSYGAGGSNAAVICCQPPMIQGSIYPSSAAAYPLRIGADSEKSLSATLAALKRYLMRPGTAITLADLSFTLSRRIQERKFQWIARASSIEAAVSALEENNKPIIRMSAPERHVVLLFSGQSKHHVLLNRQFYDAQPTLRYHIEKCSAALLQFGFPQILPAIFQEEAIEDPVVLQCATFALQYSCARSWIDGGLKVDTIVGHSFGELTGLVVSGALTLEDGLLLVATRAMLIKTKWGVERGTMLVIHVEHNTADKIALMVPGVEIACYNAPSSQVLVGSAASIDEVERLLSSEYPRVECKRLNVSHGFHSRFTQPLLPDLQELNDKLSFKTPSLPLETCTKNPVAITMPNYLVHHVREPVYFVDAIRRVEKKHGSCFFLEAGTDGTITDMAKRAVVNPKRHVFQPLSSHREQHDLASATLALWTERLSVSFWPFVPIIGMDIPRPQQVWLPPYQFDRSNSFWLPFVDRIHEAQDLGQISTTAKSKAEEGRFLVSSLSTLDGRYKVHTGAERFISLVSGHAVRGQPLCPASLYMECVTMAVQLAGNDLHGKSLLFENISYSAALGNGACKETMLGLETSDLPESWKFSVYSSLTTTTLRKSSETHATGKLTIGSRVSDQNRLVERLVAERVSTLQTRSDVDSLSETRAYSLFSRVVRYGKVFRGMSNIIMATHEAIAFVNVPPCTVYPGQSIAVRHCETVVLDTFIQVLGLLINSSAHVDEDSVCIASGLDSATITNSADFDAVREYNVYATYSQLSQKQFVGDVFALERSSGKLVCTFAGVQFAQLPIIKLEKLLEGANRKPDSPNIHPPPTIEHEIQPKRSVLMEHSRLATPVVASAKPTEFQPAANASLALKEIIATYSSIPVVDIKDDAILADLGIDSLAAVELRDLISDQFGVTITSVELLSINVASLSSLLSQNQPQSKLMAHTPLNIQVSDRQEPAKTSGLPDVQVQANHDQFLHLLYEATGTPIEDIRASDTLQAIGADSLSFVGLKHDLESCFGVNLEEAGLSTASTVEEVRGSLALSYSSNVSETPSSYDTPSTPNSSYADTGATASAPLAGIKNAHVLLALSMERFDTNAQEHSFEGYWDNVDPEQERLLVAYLVEALAQMDVHLQSMRPGDLLPTLVFSRKHQRVVYRLLKVLEEHGVIETADDGVRQRHIRGKGEIPEKPAKDLNAEFSRRHPAYSCEAALMELTGANLALCLRGSADPLALLFGRPASQEIVARFYKQSPMMATMTEQLVEYLQMILQQSDDHASIRILEVGAGSGGTTARVAELLSEYASLKDLRVQYVFTDISANLVRKGAKNFAKYKFISFEVLDLETVTEEVMQGGPFDIIIGTNCVHATSNRTIVCQKLRTLLCPDEGLLILSEITDVAKWYDSVFGLLDGWWMDSSDTYAIQPASYWMQSFKQAGFTAWSYSTGTTREANSQQLLIATNFAPRATTTLSSLVSNLPATLADVFSVEPVVYKLVDATPIHADIYFPAQRPSSSPMAIALMIHGGGHITLSRSYIRLHQAAYLLEHNILPISIDYRLCPEINLIDGAMTDVRDAVSWARTTLPAIAGVRGIILDSSKVIMVGWSSGGHLAMTTAWTTVNANIPPPTAILSFYAPVNFEPGELDGPEAMMKELPPGMGEMPLAEIAKQLSGSKPITGYNVPGGGEMGWLRPGDARCELVLSLFREGRGLEIMLHGINSVSAQSPARVEATLIDSISPLAQARSGTYQVPTFIVHGDHDEIVPFQSAEGFILALKTKGLDCEILPVHGARHLYDLVAKPGTRIWEQGVLPGLEFLVRAVRD